MEQIIKSVMAEYPIKPISIENFVNILKNICLTCDNGWLQIIYAKFLENEVFN